MLDLPLSEPESRFLQTLIDTREPKVYDGLQRAASEQMMDLLKRGVLSSSMGMTMASAFAFKQIRARADLWIDAVSEVLSTSGLRWSSDLGDRLYLEVEKLLERAAVTHLERARSNAVGHGIAPDLFDTVVPEQASRQIASGYDRIRRELRREIDLRVYCAAAASVTEESREISGGLRIAGAHTEARQELHVSNCTIGELSVATGDITMVNHGLWGDSAPQIESLLQQISDALHEDNSLSPEQREDALRDLDDLYEAGKREPRAKRIMEYLGHVSDIASVTNLASQLGVILAQLIR